MSKILELLSYGKKRREYKKEEIHNPPNHTTSENFDSDTKEKLASTYIFNPANASKHVIKKQNKEVPPRKHSLELSKAGSPHIFPWLIAFLAVLLLLVNIAYRGKINVKIEILNEGVNRATPNVSKNAALKRGLIPKSADIAPISTSLIVGGRLNNYIIKKLGFYGAAISKSEILQDGLHLVNDGTSGWASAGIDLIRPMDLSETTLDFFVKGAKGGESLKLILRDVENNTYMPQAHNIIFNGNMSADWQFISVPLEKFDGMYNSEKISHIGFEFGTQTASNEPGASIYVKKIKIVENTVIP